MGREKQYKTIVTAPGEPDIIVELSEAEYADYYERLNNPPKSRMSGKVFSDFLRSIFRDKSLQYRVTILKEVYPVLDILERDSDMDLLGYNDFVGLFESMVANTMPQGDIDQILQLSNEFVSKFDLSV